MAMTKKSILSVIFSLSDTDKEKFCCGMLDLPFLAEELVAAILYLEYYLILLKIMLPIQILPYWKWLGKSQPCMTLTLNQLLENT